MILQALKDYYDRKASDPDSGIAPLGWERKEIPFLIVVDTNGHLVSVEDTREVSGKKKVAKAFLVPMGVKRAMGIVPNLAWDNVEYATGVVCKGKPDRVKEQHRAFVERLSAFAGISSVSSVLALLGSDAEMERLASDPVFKEAAETCAFLTFRIAGATGVISSSVEFSSAYNDSLLLQNSNTARCLVSGMMDVPARLHPAIKGVAGANTTGGNIVSFNFSAACSFAKEQGANAPVGERAAFAYTTALNTLLGKESRQKLRVGDATVIFWAAKADDFEQSFGSFFAEPDKDDPDASVEHIHALYRSAQTGSNAFMTDADDTRIYVLGLAPNAARISVRFWTVGTVAEMAGRFRQYFDDLAVIHAPHEREHLSMFRLLVSTAQQGKSENVNPNLAGNFTRAVLDGAPFPVTLLQAVLVRIKAEHEVGYPRAKLIKGYLCRKLNLPQKERKRLMSLDKENENTGYRLGRLFATLEKIQTDANPGINATVRDRFYAAASSAPVTVFGNLMRMSNHWLSKVESEKPGLAVVRKQLIGEIAAAIAAFPAHLSLADQGFFALGYYHQQQNFYTKKQTAENENN